MKHLFLYVPRQMGQLGGGDPDLSSAAVVHPSVLLSGAFEATGGGVGDLTLSGVTELTSMHSGVGKGWPDIDMVLFFRVRIVCLT